MLTVADEARDYLFFLLDCIREHIPEGKCFRLVRAEAGGKIAIVTGRPANSDVTFEHAGTTCAITPLDCAR
jgi:hypothetical protein